MKAELVLADQSTIEVEFEIGRNLPTIPVPGPVGMALPMRSPHYSGSVVRAAQPLPNVRKYPLRGVPGLSIAMEFKDRGQDEDGYWGSGFASVRAI